MRNQRTRHRSSPTRLLLILVVMALVGAACGSDDSDDSAEADAESSFAEESGSDGDDGSVEADSGEAGSDDVGSDDDAVETSPAMEDGDTSSESAADESTDAAAGESDRAASDDDAGISAEDAELQEQPRPQAGLLTAGDIDDNLNYGFFLDYLLGFEQDYGQNLATATMDGRINLVVTDGQDRGLANARLELEADNGARATAFTNAAGVSYFYPAANDLGDWGELSITATAADGQATGSTTATRAQVESDQLAIEVATTASAPSALDLALVIDTTGSMGDELNYLTTELISIIDRVAETNPNVDIRVSLVLYRDEGDEYVTRVFDFSGDIAEVQARLADQRADGGGDYPEAMDEAISEAIELSWRSGDVSRVMIVNADAPPHGDRFDEVLDATVTAQSRGIRIYPLAASGVADEAEYLMRVMAAQTGGRHLFLTDDSGIGSSHQEPKIQCYLVTRLDQLLVRVLNSEVAGQRIEPTPEQVIRSVGSYDLGYCTDEN